MRRVIKKCAQGILFVTTYPLTVVLDKLQLGSRSPEIIWISPDKIQKTTAEKKLTETKWMVLPRVRGGGWDVETISWEMYTGTLYTSITKRYEHEQPWAETGYYQQAIKGITSEDGMYTGRFDSRADVETHFANLDSMYEEISNGQYKRAVDVFDSQHDTGGLLVALQRRIEEHNDVSIDFDRNGEPLFVGDGTHRLCMAKVAGVESIPAHVHVRHKRWNKARDAICEYCQAEGNPHPITHPDIPFEDNLIPTEKIIDELRDEIQGTFLLEYTDYVFPIFSIEIDRVPTYSYPSTETIRALNTVFESNSQYDFTQVDDETVPSDTDGTAIFTTLGCQSPRVPEVISDRLPNRVIVIRTPDQESHTERLLDYTHTKTLSASDVVCDIFSNVPSESQISHPS